MWTTAERAFDLPISDDIDASIDEVLRLSGEDPREALRALILGQRSLQEAYAGMISAGYVRRRPD